MAKNKQEQPSSKSVKTKSQNALQAIILRATLLTLIIVSASFAGLALVDQPQRQNNKLIALSQFIADGQVAVLNQQLDNLQRRLASFAQSNELQLALDQSDSSHLEHFKTELQRSFPEADSSNIISLGRLGIAALDKDQAKLRNNIEIDLVRRASNGEIAGPEAYQFQKNWFVSLAYPVKKEQLSYAYGAIMIRMDAHYLAELLSQSDGALGKTELLQNFGNKTQTVISAGSGDIRQLRTLQATAVPHWQISFTPSAAMAGYHTDSLIIFWIALGISCAVIIGCFLFVLSAVSSAIKQNLAQVTDKNHRDYTLPGFAQLAKQFQATVTLAKHNSSAAQERLTESKLKDDSNAPDQGDLSQSAIDIPDTIFRAYDIRGLADAELSDPLCRAIGRAIGSEAIDQGQQTIIVAADGRHSSPRIRDALVKGLCESGRDVIDIGIVPTPLMYFATHQLGTQSGIMITGSHNPAEYNGIKIVIDGKALSGKAIQQLKQRILNQQFSQGSGKYQSEEIIGDYVDYIINDIAIAQPLKIVVDAGNGVAGAVAPQLLEELGCEIIPLYCDVDGDFPNHHPDPSVPANLADLIARVREEGADLGIAFDGDGDRLGAVTASGAIVAADQLLMLFAQDIVSRNPGADVLFDVKCTRNLNNLISHYGGRPIMWKTGHSYMKEKMRETGALLGGEFSGHIFFKERWFGFDDGIYAAARLIEILSTTDPDLDAQLADFPKQVSTPELKVATSEERKFAIIDALISGGGFEDGKVTTLDGLRVDYPDGWGLVRASNTTPTLVLRFEADNQQSLQRIQSLFKQFLIAADSSLEFEF